MDPPDEQPPGRQTENEQPQPKKRTMHTDAPHCANCGATRVALDKCPYCGEHVYCGTACMHQHKKEHQEVCHSISGIESTSLLRIEISVSRPILSANDVTQTEESDPGRMSSSITSRPPHIDTAACPPRPLPGAWARRCSQPLSR